MTALTPISAPAPEPRPVLHGEWAGYLHHKRTRSPACPPCLEAKERLVRENRERGKQQWERGMTA